jgi:membrane protein
MANRMRAALRRESPWALGGLSIADLTSRVIRECWKDEVLDRAAALSFYFLFALFPALLFLTALLGVLPMPGLMDRFTTYLAQVLPADAASTLQRTLREIVRGAGGSLVSIGVLVALWSGSGGMASVMTALNITFDVDDPRPWWKRRLLAIALTIGFSLFIVSGLVLMVFGPKIGAAVASWFGLGAIFTSAWNILSVPVVILFVVLGLGLVYYLAPATDHRWKWLSPGAAVAVALWLAASLALRQYVAYFNSYNIAYGSIGGVIVLLLWLYLTSLALLVGAEVNSEIEHAAEQHGATTLEPKSSAEMPATGNAAA